MLIGLAAVLQPSRPRKPGKQEPARVWHGVAWWGVLPRLFTSCLGWLLQGCRRCLTEGSKLQHRRTASLDCFRAAQAAQVLDLLTNCTKHKPPSGILREVVFDDFPGLSGRTAWCMDACFQAELPSLQQSVKAAHFQDFGRCLAWNTTSLQSSFPSAQRHPQSVKIQTNTGAHDQLQSIATPARISIPAH